MQYLEYGLVAVGIVVLVIAAKLRVDRARRRRKGRRARRYWAAYEAGWAIVHGRRRLKRLPFHESTEDAAD